MNRRDIDLRSRAALRRWISALAIIPLCPLHLSLLLPPLLSLCPTPLLSLPLAISSRLLLLPLELPPLLRQLLDLSTKDFGICAVCEDAGFACLDLGLELLDLGLGTHLIWVGCPGLEAGNVWGQLLIAEVIIVG